MIEHLRAAWRHLTQAEKALKRARESTESDLKEAFTLSALHLIKLAKEELKKAVKLIR